MTDADSEVRPGMACAVTIIVNQVKGQLLIPNRAVRLVNGNRAVYVLKNGRPMPIQITLGASDDTSSVLLTGNLQEGDLIILNPPTQPGGPGGGGGGIRFGRGG